MARIAIIGDGPGGLSAALFLAKNGHEALVYGDDKTAVHYAHLHNYLGVPNTGGTDFIDIARAHTESHGARFLTERARDVVPSPTGLSVISESDETQAFDYVVLNEGKTPVIATALGLEVDDSGAVLVDSEQRTGLPRVYAVGRMTRPKRSQVVISAGAGAVAALDILATEAGEDIQDWDTPPKD
ncbi:MAG TPA: FAD-dependent oxidoreductase [Acidimicrobiia bacterium]|nr:FAD-dependent oxidoreductase [Acidimicrobiia bacterium]